MKKYIISIIALCLSIASFVFAMVNWSMYNDFRKQPIMSVPGDVVDNNGNDITDGVHQMPGGMTFQPMTASEVNKSVTIRASVTPDNATNQELDYILSWANEASDWAKGKTVTDYLSITPETDGAHKATLTCLQDFGAQAILTVVSRYRPSVSTSCTIDFRQYVKRINFSFVRGTKMTGGAFSDQKKFTFDDTVDEWNTPNGNFPVLSHSTSTGLTGDNKYTHWYGKMEYTPVFSIGSIPMIDGWSIDAKPSIAVIPWYNPAREAEYLTALASADAGIASSIESGISEIVPEYGNITGSIPDTGAFKPFAEFPEMQNYFKSSVSDIPDRVFIVGYYAKLQGDPTPDLPFMITNVYGWNWDKTSLDSIVTDIELDQSEVEF